MRIYTALHHRLLIHPLRWLSPVAHILGLDQQRCTSCLDPYLPQRIDDVGFCPHCLTRMPRRLLGYCPLCGEIAAEDTATPALCGACLTQTPPWTEFRFYGLFHGELRDVLHRAKFRGDTACLRSLGRILARLCADLPCPDAIVPMPLHPERLRARGYNQCREMALPVASALHRPLRDDLLYRSRHSHPQTGLSRKERQGNMQNIFVANHAVQDLSLLLIDDTATTGASLRAACHALLDAGAARVDVVVVAHASLHHGDEETRENLDWQNFPK